MTRRLRTLLTCLLTGGTLLSTPSCHQDMSPTQSLANEVDPLIGTDWVGNTYPGASVPFGMVQLSPDNGLPGWDRIAGYFYPDSTIAGFSHTHLSGTGAGDMYDISFLPVLEPALRDTLPLGLHARFSHQEERASAGYYAVRLRPYDIEVELTATEHCGVQRYTFYQESDSACIVLNLHKAMNWDRTTASHISIPDSSTLSGYRHSDGWARDQHLYFYTRLSRAPYSIQLDSLPLTSPTGKVEGWGHIARMYYRVAKGDTLVLTTALSSTSEAGAKVNHDAEATHFNFDRYHAEAIKSWDDRLSTIEIKGADSTHRRIFYTALYHSLLCPTLYSDVNGLYRGGDGKLHQGLDGVKHYSTFSLWDTYRSAHPLYSLIAPRETHDMVASLLDFGEEVGGHLPVWPMHASETDMMIGYHSVPVIVESILKGLYPLSPESKARVIRLLRSTAERDDYRGIGLYRQLGYVPCDRERESLSKTLEYAYDDYAIAELGHYLGDSTLVHDYTTRSKSYRQVWDSVTGFFRPRLSNGSWRTPFDPFAYTEDVTESNAYQYLMSVQQTQGLLELMGGADKLARRLDEFFSTPTPKHVELPIFSTGMIGQYAHGNEPGHHVPFLYNIARQPWRTTDLTRQITESLYTDKPDGLCGNEDCGQMSAWYVLTALGIYPIDPVSLHFELVSPLFPESKLLLPQGKTFTIVAHGLSPQRRYIKSVRLNGEIHPLSYVTYQQIVVGGTLELEMTEQSGLCWY